MIRAFVAIPLPDDAADALELRQAGLRVGRHVTAENFHITLCFLGNHPEPVVEDAHYALSDIRVPPLSLTIAGLGAFGDQRPRSLHAVVRPNPSLTALREKVVRAIRGAGITLPRERFVPHVTLARFGNGGLRGEALLELQAYTGRHMGFTLGPLPVEHFTLFESRLTGSGPIYEPLAEYPVGETAGAVWTGVPG
ncbi:MAG: RNA 2',3'-cyclic phosphodiesterase [Pseudomonadota bacterium]